MKCKNSMCGYVNDMGVTILCDDCFEGSDLQKRFEEEDKLLGACINGPV